jgi:hypothetical protein
VRLVYKGFLIFLYKSTQHVNSGIAFGSVNFQMSIDRIWEKDESWELTLAQGIYQRIIFYYTVLP